MQLHTIQSKLPKVGTTIFTEMTMLAQQHNAINLGQGFPDFPMSAGIVQKVHGAMSAGFNQYTHMNGLPALRDLLAKKANHLYGAAIDPEQEITITPGGTYAIYTAFTCLLQPGDEVIVFEPAYDSYIPNIEANGAVAITIALQHPGYHINWQEVRSKISLKTRAIIINSPHNPTGAVLSAEDMKSLEELVADTNIYIISDEVYEHLVFDGMTHESVLKYPALYKRSFVCFSFGKTYHCTGWKLGYCIAPPALSAEFRKLHQFNAFCCNTPMQVALAAHLQEHQDYLQLGAEVQQRRDYFLEAMQQSRFKPLPSHGSYFQLYSYAQVSDETEKEFAKRLVREYGVATIPVSAFYQQKTENQVLRFCFIKKEKTLMAAAGRLSKL